MVHELEPTEFHRVMHCFPGLEQYVPVMSVIAGNFPGRVFADDRDEPQTALVWAVSRWGYIEGKPDNIEFNRNLPDLLRQVIIPDSRRISMNWFELYTRNSARWMQELELILRDFKSERHFESVYTLDRHRYKIFRKGYSFPEGWVVRRYDVPVLPESSLDAPFVPHEFRIRTAFAFRVIVQGRTVAECRSNGFTTGVEFMIDVNTFNPDDRGKGCAAAASVALLDYSLETGLIPLWETTEDNIASRRLAEKLGFVERDTYPVYAIEF